jgi:hypothetical protein
MWCPACNWNLDPLGGSRDLNGEACARARRERIFDRVLATGTGAAPPNAALYVAIALATAVNLVTVALVGTGAWLLVVGTWPERILGLLELLVALVLRPRFAHVPTHILDRVAAPTLHAVTERITVELGAQPVELIAVDRRYGSGYITMGPCRRRVLVLGLALWETLTTDQRLALLAYELGHAIRRGRRSARWIQTALDALTVWADVLQPDPVRQSRLDAPTPAGTSRRSTANGLANLSGMIARPFLALLAQGARMIHQLLSRLTDHAGGLAGYRADETAARVASASSAEGLLRALLLHETAVLALERFARGNGDIWEKLRTHLASIPDTERARLLRLSQLRGDASSDDCPPTYLRIQFVRKLPYLKPAVTVSSTEAKAIDAELQPVRASLAKELRDDAY